MKGGIAYITGNHQIKNYSVEIYGKIQENLKDIELEYSNKIKSVRNECTKMLEKAKNDVKNDWERYQKYHFNVLNEEQKELMAPSSKLISNTKTEERRISEKLELMKTQLALIMQISQKCGLLTEEEVCYLI